MKNVSEFQVLFKFLCHYKYNKAVSCVQKKSTKYLHFSIWSNKGKLLIIKEVLCQYKFLNRTKFDLFRYLQYEEFHSMY